MKTFKNNGLKKIYIAAPLFNDSERDFNKKLSVSLSSIFDVYLPQEDGGLLVNLIKSGIDNHTAYSMIFNHDINALHECDYLLIVMDGRSIDEGAAFELGVAYSLDKKCFGLQTDSRRLLTFGNNPMIQCSVSKVFASISDIVDYFNISCDIKSHSHNLVNISLVR